MYVWIDDVIETRRGRVPYWTSTKTDYALEDKQLVWIYAGYDTMKLYKVHKVDNDNFIAEDLGKTRSLLANEWNCYLEFPELIPA